MKTEGGNSTEDSKYVAYCLATERKKNSHPDTLFSVRKTRPFPCGMMGPMCKIINCINICI